MRLLVMLWLAASALAAPPQSDLQPPPAPAATKRLGFHGDSMFDKISHWFFPGDSGRAISRSPYVHGSPRFPHPPPPRPKLKCNPCNKVPWVPIPHAQYNQDNVFAVVNAPQLLHQGLHGQPNVPVYHHSPLPQGYLPSFGEQPEIIPSIPVANFVSSVEYPVNVVQSPIIDVGKALDNNNNAQHTVNNGHLHAEHTEHKEVQQSGPADVSITPSVQTATDLQHENFVEVTVPPPIPTQQQPPLDQPPAPFQIPLFQQPPSGPPLLNIQGFQHFAPPPPQYFNPPPAYQQPPRAFTSPGQINSLRQVPSAPDLSPPPPPPYAPTATGLQWDSTPVPVAVSSQNNNHLEQESGLRSQWHHREINHQFQESRIQESHALNNDSGTTARPPTTHVLASDIRALLEQQRPNNNLLRLQNNIDQWTAQEFSNELVLRAEHKSTTSAGTLAPSKNIPSEYFTTAPFSTPKPFDHEAAGSIAHNVRSKDSGPASVAPSTKPKPVVPTASSTAPNTKSKSVFPEVTAGSVSFNSKSKPAFSEVAIDSVSYSVKSKPEVATGTYVVKSKPAFPDPPSGKFLTKTTVPYLSTIGVELNTLLVAEETTTVNPTEAPTTPEPARRTTWEQALLGYSSTTKEKVYVVTPMSTHQWTDFTTPRAYTEKPATDKPTTEKVTKGFVIRGRSTKQQATEEPVRSPRFTVRPTPAPRVQSDQDRGNRFYTVPAPASYSQESRSGSSTTEAPEGVHIAAQHSKVVTVVSSSSSSSKKATRLSVKPISKD